jgi:hypothetical protein
MLTEIYLTNITVKLLCVCRALLDYHYPNLATYIPQINFCQTIVSYSGTSSLMTA